jgi:hypothetical protein
MDLARVDERNSPGTNQGFFPARTQAVAVALLHDAYSIDIIVEMVGKTMIAVTDMTDLNAFQVRISYVLSVLKWFHYVSRLILFSHLLYSFFHLCIVRYCYRFSHQFHSEEASPAEVISYFSRFFTIQEGNGGGK